ncbi:LOW QUALITY PROTEIN: cerebellar degeneration-related protein 2 [Cyclopterus lumpus]|uniref:LOW QUALITY PROTEIN: cerebellar degeneration-related protein 2 n=1 Tax=Cyclopterus lumpus TaxID=8103 RepID=UPI0014865800|nr:LOW QUALITY PROTEIN: cerebellar degeneration-related protein 2 [Cyclopterus lumpus]
MLTDVILEEEFDKNGESWYDPRDLERDLHLAAEFGKTLLDRNHELEQALQQMYSTNQEQLQEIEHLNKQVDLLRQMNDQHAKVYEQLDVAARDLEQGNLRLVQDRRLAQQKIHSLTETIEGLQTYMEDLQTQVEELKTAQAERNKRELAEQRRHLGAQSVSCLKELYDLHHDRHLDHDGLHVDGLWTLRGSFYDRDRCKDPEEGDAALQRSVQTIQSQIAVERSRREAAERERELTSRENRGLEERLASLAGCTARQKELEAQVEQLRLLWRADCANSIRRPELLLPDKVFFASEDRPSPGLDEIEEKVEKDEEPRQYVRQRSNSDSVLRAASTDEMRRGHEQLCIRRTEAVKQRGISLLNEVDAQYSALQVKYDELLRRCQQADGPSLKAAQTPGGPHASSRTRRRRSSAALCDPTGVLAGQQPEYRALFEEIFTCIQKTKVDLGNNRSPVEDAGSA